MKRSVLLLVLALGLVVVACAPSTPQVVEKEVVVEKPVVETVVVEKEKVVEKPVVETVIIEKEKVVEVTPKRPITVGYLAPELNAFHANCMNSTMKYAEEKGWAVIPLNADGDAEKQASQVEYLISLGVDAIIATPVDSMAFCASVKKAEDAGIPVYCIDRSTIGCKVHMTVQADNYLGGQQSAEAIVKFLTEKYGEPKGLVLELQGDMGQNVAQLRSAGFNDTMKKYPNIKVISKPTEWLPDKFLKATLDVVSTQPVDAIFTHSDVVGTTPILSALEQLGKKIPRGQEGHIFLASIDGSPTGLDAIRKGFQDQASSQPNPDFGILVNYIAIELEGGTIKEGPVVKEGALWSPAKIFMSDSGLMLNLATTNVTPENVDDPRLWGNF
jgi:ABC-type sugar transport system substrate-binding protein